jgi:hypothetical protein
MYGTINNQQPKSTTRPTLAMGFKFIAAPSIPKGLVRVNDKNDSGIHQGSEQSGNITGQVGETPGDDGMGKALHD